MKSSVMNWLTQSKVSLKLFVSALDCEWTGRKCPNQPSADLFL